MRNTIRKFALILLSIFSSVFLAIWVYQNKYSPILILLWLYSIIVFVISQWEQSSNNVKINLKSLLKPKTILLGLVLILPLIVRIFNFRPDRIHGDDLLSAYFSAHLNLLKDNFFAPIPQNKGEWVCQFPSVYFFLQKIFFLFFGESSQSVKFSILPYVFVISLMLFLLVKKNLNTETAIISVILYSFFSPSLYLETLGLSFMSSTAVFLIFFYFLTAESENSFFSALTGVFCGLCYLFYASSYFALPVLAAYFTLRFLSKQKIIIMKNFLISIFGFYLVVSPFIAFMSKTKSYYLTGRVNQVNLINGSWSNTQERLRKGESIISIVKENFLVSVKSLYTDGIGGYGGYNFGHLALFEKFSFFIFCVGIAICVFLASKNITTFFALLIITVSFIFGIVLSLPPPAFHHFSIAFPFLIWVMSIPFYFLLSPKLNRKLIIFLILSVLIVYSVKNQKYFIRITFEENNNESIRLASYILDNYPSRNIYIASFSGFVFEKIFFFVKAERRTPKFLGVFLKKTKVVSEDSTSEKTKILTDYHINFLNNFNSEEKYVYVIIFPQDFNKKFEEKDNKGKIIEFSNNYSLFIN